MRFPNNLCTGDIFIRGHVPVLAYCVLAHVQQLSYGFFLKSLGFQLLNLTVHLNLLHLFFLSCLILCLIQHEGVVGFFQDDTDQFVAKFRSVLLSENRSIYFTIHNPFTILGPDEAV
ncbi:hypothetical protein DSY0838 [Desulfitobacterium hafniense Y51]|uniref:Uncharacterized protein n=1 Tax=Desulfitobacterium hafniense (strain Y51) TaxID=138119 RepID=Q24ZB5_DESHY|nr:hypothetical protein DSY0838 [Desulfitobacterium hafniense Y51]